MMWTKAQEKAINTIDNNVLVSAAAGSGKTAVMIERVIQLVINKKIDVNNILVLTFASDAASEMRTRLVKALKENIKKDGADKAFLARQLSNIAISSICTFHSFCLDILRSYFYKVNLDPQFSIISAGDLDSLKNQSVIEVINEFINNDDSVFIELMDIFAVKRRDTAFKNILLDIYNFAIAKENFHKFLQQDFISCYENENIALEFVYNYISKNASSAISRIETTIKNCKYCDLQADYNALFQIQEYMQRILQANDIYAMCDIINENPRFPSGCNEKKLTGEQVVFHEDYKIARDFARDILDKLRKNFAGSIQYLQDEIQENIKYCKKLAEVTIRFKNILQEKKQKRAVVDFNDFEHYCLQILQDESIKTALMQKYAYIFIDEYQDTNGVQESILSQITNNSNMFMVGDVKQSIYGFRHCSPQIFLDKYNSYLKKGGGYAIELNENFRSRNGILQLCNSVFDVIMTQQFGGSNYHEQGAFVINENEELDDFKNTAGIHIIDIMKNRGEKLSGKMYDMFCEQDHISVDKGSQYEAHLIANLIDDYIGKNIYDKKIHAMRPVSYADIAILTRGYSNYNLQILQYLQNVKCFPIVSTAEESSDYSVEILQDLARVIDNECQDYPLTSVMLSVFGGFTESQLADIKIHQRQNCKVKYFYESVKYCLNDNAFYLQDSLKKFFDRINKYRNMMTFEGVSSTLLYAINECGYDNYILKKASGRNRMIKVYNYLSALSASVYSHDLSGYLYDADMKSKLCFGDSSIAQSNSISMMTIHKSKGLEFPIVIICGCGQMFNLEDNRQKIVIDDVMGAGIDRYDISSRVKTQGFIKQAIKAKLHLKSKEEEMRLLYVAMTRAQNHLDIVAFSSLKDIIQNREILHENQINSYIDMLAYFLKSYNAKQHNFVRVCEYAERDFNFESQHVPQIEVSYSNIDDDVKHDMLRRLSFKYSKKVDIDSSQKYSVSAISQNDIAMNELRIKRGNFFHALLEKCNIGASVEQIKDVSSNLRLDFEATDTEYNMVYNVLNSDFMKSFAGNKIYREQEFMLYISPSEVNLRGEEPILLQGKIDMIVMQDDGVIIIDFKSGSYSEKSARSKYSTQLDLYSKAIEKIIDKKVKQRIIYSIEGNNYFVI